MTGSLQCVDFRAIPARHRGRMRAVSPQTMDQLERLEARSSGRLYVVKSDWRAVLDDLPAARSVKDGQVVRVPRPMR